MNNPPILFNENSIMSYFNMKPSEVKGQWNAETTVYKRYLWYLIYSCFKFNLPEQWSLPFFRYWLFQYGSIAIIYTKKFGWICSPYGIEELDLYYRPSKIIVYNRLLDEFKNGQVGINCEIIRLLDDYYGLDDTVRVFSETLSNIDGTIKQNLMNSRVGYYMEVNNKKDAQDFKLMMEKIYSGEPCAYINKNVGNGESPSLVFNNVKNSYIVGDLIDAKHNVINEFLTRVGIRNANTDKKERLNSKEVTENNGETYSLVSVMYDSIKECFNKLNKISGLDLSVSLVYDYSDGGGAKGNDSNTVRNE